MNSPKIARSHGTGLGPWVFKKQGTGVIIEHGALVFHPENITLGDNVYIGHYASIKGYYDRQITIGDGCWIGQYVFMHACGGIEIGKNVGIGPRVNILSSYHEVDGSDGPILHQHLVRQPTVISEECDIGVNATILSGVILAKGIQVAAGAVVTKSVDEPYCIISGVPAKISRMRKINKTHEK